MARERGQGSVELVAVVPLVALAGAVAVQVGVAAHAWGAAREAARAGARAVQVDAPARDAARRMLGGTLSDGSRVRVIEARDGSRRVSVSVAVPMLVPWVPGPSVSADARVPG
jgi:Flp pilus assembly protein TadG